MTISRRIVSQGALALAASAAVPRRAAASETERLRIASPEGFAMLPLFIALDRRMIVDHAEYLGLEGVTVEHVSPQDARFTPEGLLNGQLDVIVGSVPGLLMLWDKTNGEVKAVADLGGQVLTLVTRNPGVRAIADFGPHDRIAVPDLKLSPQSLMIGMALDKALGPGALGKLDSIQVRLGDADAMAMLLDPNGEVDSHFAAPPYAVTELKSEAPKIHAVLTSLDVLGGPATFVVAYATRRFVEENPIKAAALVSALDEAQEVIANHRMSAAESYLGVTHEKYLTEALAELLTGEGALYSGVPTRTMLIAGQMARSGLISRVPADWKAFHFRLLHDRPGS